MNLFSRKEKCVCVCVCLCVVAQNMCALDTYVLNNVYEIGFHSQRMDNTTIVVWLLDTVLYRCGVH